MIKYTVTRERNQTICRTKENYFPHTDTNKANISDFIKVRKFYSKNPIIDYLNVNSLENKVIYFSFNKKSVKCKTS